MATTNYQIAFRNAGALTAGLTPVWSALYKLSDGTSVANPNTVAPITELGGGLYKIAYDPEGANGELAGIIDGTATITSAADRYIDICLAADSSRATRLDAAMSSRASQTSLNTVDDFLDTEIAAIKAKTDNLPSDPADASVIAARFDAVDASIADIPTLSEIQSAIPGVITRSGPSTLTALDSGIDGTIGLFVGDRYSLTIKATIGSDPPGGTGAVWTASTTDEATGAAIVTDAALTEISEEIGYFAYALAAGDTTSARRVRLTVKRTLGSDVRIFGPLVLNVRDR